jgi:hypothetical protein
MYLQLSSKCHRQIYQHQPTYHSGWLVIEVSHQDLLQRY